MAHFAYMALYGLLVAFLLFSFYTAICFLIPRKNAEMLRKNGGFIPGIRPGKPTTEYLRLHHDTYHNDWGNISCLYLFVARSAYLALLTAILLWWDIAIDCCIGHNGYCGADPLASDCASI